MAAMAYGGLASVLHARGRIEQAMERTEAFQRAYWIMRDDFLNGAPRAVEIGQGQPEPALIFNTLTARVDFTRRGWSNPMDLPRSTLERVGYILDGTRLLRRQWPVLDRTVQTQPRDTPLLEGITTINWRFLDANMQWQQQWPAMTSGSSTIAVQSLPAPRAVSVQLTTTDWGIINFEFCFGVLPPASGTS
jgi:general secretion pathway protein J